MTEGEQPLPGECFFPAVRVTALECFVIIDMVVYLVTYIDPVIIYWFSPVRLPLLIYLIQINSLSTTIPPLKHPFLLKSTTLVFSRVAFVKRS